VNIGSLAGASGFVRSSSGIATLGVGSNNIDTRFDGILQDGGGQLRLQKGHNGKLTLIGANTYTGGTQVDGGTLQVGGTFDGGLTFIGSESALGTGQVTIYSGGKVVVWLTGAGTKTIGNDVALAGGTLHSEDGGNIFSGLVTLDAGGSTNTISARWNDVVTFSGGLHGSADVFTRVADNSGPEAPTFLLSAAGSATGSVRVMGRSSDETKPTSLQLGHVDALKFATLDLASGDQGLVTFGITGTNTYKLGALKGTRNLELGVNSLSVGGNGASTTYSGVLSGSGGLTKTGDGILTPTGANTYFSDTVVRQGTLRIGGLGRGWASCREAATPTLETSWLGDGAKFQYSSERRSELVRRDRGRRASFSRTRLYFDSHPHQGEPLHRQDDGLGGHPATR
jgi:autotransporter-associated beta strand protein